MLTHLRYVGRSSMHLRFALTLVGAAQLAPSLVVAQEAAPAEAGPASVEATDQDAPAEAPSADAVAKAAADKQREEAAKVAYTQGAKAATEGKLDDALSLYRKADELVPAAAPKYKIALTLDKMERFAEAETAYQAFLESKPDPEKFFSKIDSAKERIRALHEMPGRIKVTTTPDAPPNLVLAVDRIPQTGNDIVVMPGSHNVTAVADGWNGSKTITIGPAEVKDVAITLIADRPAQAPVAATPAPAAAVAPVIVRESSHATRNTAFVMFGLAGVQAIVGTVFAIQAVNAQSSYDARPSPETLASVDRQTGYADAFYATALVSAVTGTVLLLVDNSSSGSSDK